MINELSFIRIFGRLVFAIEIGRVRREKLIPVDADVSQLALQFAVWSVQFVSFFKFISIIFAN